MYKRMLGETIYRLRKAKGLSQSELGELVGVSNKAVSKWETYEANPDITLLPLLALSLGVTTDELLTDIKAEKKDFKPEESNSLEKQGIVINTSEEVLITVYKEQYDNVHQMMKKWLEEMNGLSAKEKLTGILAKNLNPHNFHSINEFFSSQISTPRLVMARMIDNINSNAPVFAEIFKEGLEDGSIKTEFPDECAQVLFLLMNIWCDPMIFECDITILKRRIAFLQQMMKKMGADIFNDELVKDYTNYLEKFYLHK